MDQKYHEFENVDIVTRKIEEMRLNFDIEVRQQSAQLFSMIWGVCSTTSQNQIKVTVGHHEFEIMRSRFDALQLWQVMKHTTPTIYEV